MELYPLLMAPYYRCGSKTPWGGEMLRDAFMKDCPAQTGESLEISALEGRESVVRNGKHAGKNLRRMIGETVRQTVATFRKRHPDKTIIVSEMGTCGVYGHRDPAAAQWTEDFEAEYVGDVIDAVFGEPEIAGLTIWQFTDSRSYHRGGSTIRTKPFAANLAGLYDGYRRAKAVVPVVREKFRAK